MAKKKQQKASASDVFAQADQFNVRVTRDAMTRETLIMLGRYIADMVHAAHQKLTVTVWTANGQRLFSQAGDGTTSTNDLYCRRKLQTVLKFGMSTMALHVRLAESGKSLQERYALSESEFATCGGGIPIYVHDLMVAVVTVSGLPHDEDHRELVRMLHEFFGGDNAGE